MHYMYNNMLACCYCLVSRQQNIVYATNAMLKVKLKFCTTNTVMIRIAARAGIYFRRSNPRRHFESGSCLNTGSYNF